MLLTQAFAKCYFYYCSSQTRFYLNVCTHTGATLDIKVDHIHFKLKINRPAISTLFHNGLGRVFMTQQFLSLQSLPFVGELKKLLTSRTRIIILVK